METFDKTWAQAKKQFIKNWASLNNKELDQTRGDQKALAELLQHKFVISYEQAAAAVSEIMAHFKNQALFTGDEEPKMPVMPDEVKKNEPEEQPSYPNKLYEEDLPPDIKLSADI